MDLKVTAPSLLEANVPLDLAKLFEAIQTSARKKLSKDNVINIKTGGK
tara:strand:- start:565 stop:708 length:144 start_codon:yes stop_codon:yes gene_type:complete